MTLGCSPVAPRDDGRASLSATILSRAHGSPPRRFLGDASVGLASSMNSRPDWLTLTTGRGIRRSSRLSWVSGLWADGGVTFAVGGCKLAAKLGAGMWEPEVRGGWKKYSEVGSFL